METYLDRIKKLKNERKITTDRLSEMTGIPLGTLSKILAGMSDSPKLSNVVAICGALGCSVEYIVNGTPENTNNYTLDGGETAHTVFHGQVINPLQKGVEKNISDALCFVSAYPDE